MDRKERLQTKLAAQDGARAKRAARSTGRTISRMLGLNEQLGAQVGRLIEC
jgi:hypothetical protein